MGQKVHPHGFRLGYIYDWNSKWFADKNYTEQLHEDLQIRRTIENTTAPLTKKATSVRGMMGAPGTPKNRPPRTPTPSCARK